MSSTTILDSRATLDLSIKGVKLVEASAGTGKTYAIGNLYLRMLLEGYSISQILVVTFTKAATEELRGRIRQRIYDALRALEDIEHTRLSHKDEFLKLWAISLTDQQGVELARRQLRVALTSMDEAAIYTIHGFCQRSLTEYAFNSRQAFDIDMITDDRQIWQDAIKDWWRINTYSLDEAVLQVFTDAVGSLDDLIKLQVPLRKPRVLLLPELDVVSSWGNECHIIAENRKVNKQKLALKCKSLTEMWKQNKQKLQTILESDNLAHRGGFSMKNMPVLVVSLDSFFEAGCPMGEVVDRLSLITYSKLVSVLKKGREEPGLDEMFFALVDEVVNLALSLSGKNTGIGNSETNKIRVEALRDASMFATKRVAEVKQQSGQMAFDDQLVLLERALAGSPELAQAIRKHFPVAMIDEFQDTDAVQYGIFQHIYQSDAEADCSLIMIGDPKQAIYSFRGGDIFAYIKAKQDAAEHFTLDTNWRSTPRLIQAVNCLFSHRPDPFIYRDIPFEPVKPSGKDTALLRSHGKEVIPLTLWQIPVDDAAKVMNKTSVMPLMHAYTANEIARLLTESSKGSLTLAEEPVQPGDIAVLVRGHAEAADLRDALRERGIPAVASGKKHVFESDEATGLKLLLAAVVDCKDAGLLRQGLASSLLGFSYTEIYQTISSDQRWLDWTVQISELHQIWARKGFMSMFQQMQRMLHIGEFLAQGRTSERRLTNLFHLGELLQQTTQSITGMEALLVWFEHQLSDANSGEETELRLENDAGLVSIVTIHSSKGLEYPIVFLPYMWLCRPRWHTSELLPYYDEAEGYRCLDAAVNDEHLLLSEKERLAEDVRLTYVALTRACSKVYMAWGDAAFNMYKGPRYDSSVTALGWLLHEGQQVDDLKTHKPKAFQSGSGVVAHDLIALSEASGQTIELLNLDPEMPKPVILPVDYEQSVEIKAERFYGDISEDWRISSFSSLTRDVHQNVSPVKKIESSDTVFHFPAGSQTGLFLHALFEQMDFQSREIEAFVQRFTMRNAVRYGLDLGHGSVVQQWVNDVLHTAINMDGLKMADVSAAQRLNELSFDFPVSRLNVTVLNQVLDQAAGRALQPVQSYHSYSGYMTGVIDLIFEHDGRYYLADYKSNHLGYRLDAYAPEQLQQAIYDRRYDLQYLIYTLALHRYLKLRLPDYDYDQHIGGVYYLFLRGMRSSSGTNYGVFYDKPDRALIERLDSQVFHAEVAL